MADDAATMEEIGLVWFVPPPPPSGPPLQKHNGSAELLILDDEGSDDDDGDYMDMDYYVHLLFDVPDPTHDLPDDGEQVVQSLIHREMVLRLLARALDLDIQGLIALLEEARGGGGVPALPAVVAGLEKRTFRGGAECTVCFEEFKDGEEVSVVPCSGGHEFHTECIAKWLGQYSNVCPLCRHALPTSVNDH
ncbi:hypothetical protein BS78_08G023000 [Paspalum vaginatum]|nr:hypothetical protein BS78_08G023000 [Paspalum vaginatum]